MRTLSILLLIVCAIPAAAQNSAKAEPGKIQGVWHHKSSEDQMKLTLNADGTGELDGEAIRYTAKDNKFTVTIVAENQTMVYKYNLQGNSLTLSDGDFDLPVTFTRSGT